MSAEEATVVSPQMGRVDVLARDNRLLTDFYEHLDKTRERDKEKGRDQSKPLWAPFTTPQDNFMFVRLVAHERQQPVFWEHNKAVFLVDDTNKTIKIVDKGDRLNDGEVGQTISRILDEFSEFKDVSEN